MIQQDTLMTKAEVAQTLKCSERTLERLVRDGGFPPPLRHGKEALWFESVVQKWLQRQRDAQLAWVPGEPQLYQPELPGATGDQGSRLVAVADAGEGLVLPSRPPAAKGKSRGRESRHEARAVS